MAEKKFMLDFSGNLKERNHLEDLGIDWKIILKWILNKLVEVWAGWLGLRLGTSCGLLLTV